MNISIVVPALNEEKNIGRVIDNLKQEGYKNIIVVDDGSKDRTFQIAKEKQIHALRHVVNRGQGAALQTGMSYALLNGAEIIVHFDSDGQHKAEEIERMILTIIRNEAEVTLGSRFLSKQKIPLKRKIMLKGAILIIQIFYGIKLSDAHNGFRAFSRDAAKKVRITMDKMEHASEIVEEIKKKKILKLKKTRLKKTTNKLKVYKKKQILQ